MGKLAYSHFAPRTGFQIVVWLSEAHTVIEQGLKPESLALNPASSPSSIVTRTSQLSELSFILTPAFLHPHRPPHLCPRPFPGLSQILRLVLQELNLFYSRDVNGVCLLYDLLHSPWLQALLKVSTSLPGSLCLLWELGTAYPAVPLVSCQEIPTW